MKILEFIESVGSFIVLFVVSSVLQLGACDVKECRGSASAPEAHRNR